jgi:glutathione S-transferase
VPKIYEFTGAPNPRRVRVFLAEKGINNVPSVQVNIATGENRKPEFLKINPMGGLPVLELDDGTLIAESVAICRYFEESHPEPPLMGVDARDKAIIEMWNRRMEFEVLAMTAASFRNTSDFFKGRIPQVKEYGEIAKNAAVKRLEWLDTVLADREFIAGPRYTIADITALIGIDFGRTTQIKIQENQKNLARWHQAVSSRPSAKAS